MGRSDRMFKSKEFQSKHGAGRKHEPAGKQTPEGGQAAESKQPTPTRAQLARRIDHSLLRAQATQGEIDQLCDEATEYGFATVSVNPVWTAYCAKRLQESSVGVNPVVGFPLGATTAHVKLEEAREAVRHGAAELDMVINLGALRSGFPQYVEQEIAAIVKAAKDVPVKVILETSYLNDDEKWRVCELAVRAKAAFVKTSTGFGKSGATAKDVALMREAVGPRFGVKAAGGIRTLRDTLLLLEAGANRIGTSRGVDILKELPA